MDSPAARWSGGRRRIRLTRPLTQYEAYRLAAPEPGVRVEGDAIVLPAARLDDVAREIDTGRPARADRDPRRRARGGAPCWPTSAGSTQVRHGSHLRSQQVGDRGLH